MQHRSLADARRRFFAYQEGENHSPKQQAHYRQTFADLDRFLAATGRAACVTVLTSEVLQEFVAWLKATPRRLYRGSTQRSMVGIAGHMKDLRAFIRWCAGEERGIIDWQVTVPTPKVPKTFFPVLSDADLVQLWHSKRLTGAAEFQTRNRALVALLLDTGIRLGELARLTPADIHGAGAIRYVRVIGKGNKERLAPFTPAVGQLLDDWLSIRRQIATDDSTLFLLAERGVQILIRRIGLETGVHVFAHKDRHTAATNLVRGGADPFTVKESLIPLANSRTVASLPRRAVGAGGLAGLGAAATTWRSSLRRWAGEPGHGPRLQHPRSAAPPAPALTTPARRKDSPAVSTLGVIPNTRREPSPRRQASWRRSAQRRLQPPGPLTADR